MSNQPDNSAIMFIAKSIQDTVNGIQGDVSHIKSKLATVTLQTKINTTNITNLQKVTNSNNQSISKAKIDKKWGMILLRTAWTVILASIPIIIYFSR